MRTSPRRRSSSGFTILEMMISVAIFLVVAGGVIGLLSTAQTSYQNLEFQDQLDQSMRASMEMLAQDVGQAGSLTTSTTTLSSVIVPSAATQTVNVASGSAFYATEKVLVDTGSSQEEVTLVSASSSSIRGVFQNAHLIGAPVVALGAFLNGIRTPTAYLGSSTSGYYSNQLDLYGDIHGDGTLVEVYYYCNPQTKQFTRQEITYPATAATLPQAILLKNVTNCTTTATSGVFHYGVSPGSAVYPSVTVSITAQSLYPSPQTGLYDTLSKTINVQPRNILAEYNRVSGGDSTESQADPMAGTYPNGVLAP
jgi:prepilin-type N-terminal cleavage/methylation domain-containing protein